jgi:pimeloyl-ACP methyl ester carboxylesterase
MRTSSGRIGTVFVVAVLISVGLSPTVGHAARKSAIAWTSCRKDGRLECGQLSVPLDWNRPNGTHIKLEVIRHLASRPDARIGSIFLNPGGPGDTGVGLVSGSGDELDAFGDGRFDLVSWDPRGTNASEPVHCFTSDAKEAAFWRGKEIPTTPAASRAYQRKLVDLARRCGEVMGDVLNHISTADTARDLDALRAAVGERTMTYVGFSYGTLLGQTYANMFPSRVRAMMLDGIVDPVQYTKSSEARVANDVSSTDMVFDKFLSLCDEAGPARCALAGHPPETAAQRVARLFAAARRKPIPAPHAVPPGKLDYSDLLMSNFAPIRDPKAWPKFADDLDAAVDGDASALETAARAGRTPKSFAEATKSNAISCGDAPAVEPSTAWPTVIPRFTDISRLQGAIQGWWLWALCASNWPGHSTDRYTGPWNKQTKTPILLIGTTYDPNTSYAAAQRSEHLLGNAVLLTHVGYGHVSFKDMSQCVEDARVRYLVDLITPPRGTVCMADQVPFP